MSQYIADWLEWGRKMREEQRKNPPAAVERLRKLKAEMKAKQEDSRCCGIQHSKSFNPKSK